MKVIHANWNQSGHKWSHKRHTFTWFTITQTWEESSFSSQYYNLWLVIEINQNGKTFKTFKNELQKSPILPIYESFKPCPKDLRHLHVWSPLIKSHGVESQALNFVFHSTSCSFMFLLQLQNKGCKTLSHCFHYPLKAKIAFSPFWNKPNFDVSIQEVIWYHAMSFYYFSYHQFHPKILSKNSSF